MIALVTTAFAGGGGGAYVDVAAGGGWTDRLGPITRGQAGSVAAGAWFGKFRGTYRFGDYWRVGVAMHWNPLYEREIVKEGGVYRRQKVFVESLFLPAVEIGRGGDLMNIGGFWTLGAGPVVVSDTKSPFEHGASSALGFGATTSVATGYNVGRSFMLTLRLSMGLQVTGITSASGGFGVGFQGRVPLVPLSDDDEE